MLTSRSTSKTKMGNLLEKYVPDCTYSPLPKSCLPSSPVPAFTGTVLRAIGAVSSYPIFILPQIKQLTTLTLCIFFFFFISDSIMATRQMLTFTQLPGSMERLLQAGSDCPAPPWPSKAEGAVTIPQEPTGSPVAGCGAAWLESGSGYGPECGLAWP